MMLKYRVWDKLDQAFIYPVIDITNNFYQNYSKERFVFDKFVYEKDGVEYFENDIVIHNFENSKNPGKFMEIMCVIEPLNMNSFFGYNLSRYEDYCKQWVEPVHYYSSIFQTEWKYRRSTGSPFQDIIKKLGNIHENHQILIDHYKEKYIETKTNN